MQPHAIALVISSAGAAIGGAAPSDPVNLVVNGTFDSATGWSVPADCSISGGVLTKTPGGLTRQVTQTPGTALVQGAIYKASFDITARAAGIVNALVGGGGAGGSAVGSYTKYIVAGIGTTVGFSFSGVTDASVDNLVIYATTLTGIGPETIQDPGFDTGTGWALISSTISGSQLTLGDGSNGGSASATHSPALVAGNAYRVVYTIVSIAAGSISGTCGGATLTSRSSPGTYSQDVVTSATSGFALTVIGSSVATIDNVSVKPLTLTP